MAASHSGNGIVMRTHLRRIRTDKEIRKGLVVAVMVTVATLGTNILLTWLAVVFMAARPRRRPEAGMVWVCGHRLRAGRISPAYRRRLDALAGLMKRTPGITAVLLGGGRPSEAAAGRDYLAARYGIGAGRVHLEEVSTNSFENLRNARELLGPDGGEVLHILSSRYHLARLRVFARQLGLEARLVPAERVFIPGLGNLLATGREAAYLCWFITGRGWARLTGNRRMLVRIR